MPLPPRMNRVVRKLLGAIAVSTLAACAVGPNYHRPATPVDAHFVNATQPGFAEDAAVEQYWTRFADPVLNSLVDDAVAHNTDLRTAAANLQASRAVRRLAGVHLFPTPTPPGRYTPNLHSQHQLPFLERR